MEACGRGFGHLIEVQEHHPIGRRGRRGDLRRIPGWAGPLVACLVGLFSLGGFSCDSRKPPHEHLILITLDTTRADYLGCYGREVASTPNLDRFATRATQFDNAITPIACTLPSHATILTGLTPLRHGVRANGTFSASDKCVTLTEILGERGYTTAAFLSAFVLDEKAGLSQGFDHYDDDFELERRAHDTTARTIAWLDSTRSNRDARERPLFLWVHYFDPHQPFEPIEPFASATRGTPYDAEISAMDASLGELLAALDRHGLSSNAHIVIVADHGESLGDHGYFDHGLLLYENDVQVPFFWRTPGQQDGRRTSALVGTVDIFPTLLDLLDLERAEDGEGASLVKLLRGEALEKRSGLYLETMLPFFCYEWSPLFAWRTADWKYIEAPVPELYALRVDPLELQNLAEAQGGKVRNLASKLSEYRSRWGTTEVSEQRSLTNLEREKLESLGYIAASVPKSNQLYSSLPNPADHLPFENELVMASARLGNQRWQRALDIYEVIAEAIPRSPVATIGMGHALVGLERYEEALSWLERYLDRSPDSWKGHAIRGDALFGLKRYSEAITAYEFVALQDRGDARILREIHSHIFLQQYAEALALAWERRMFGVAFRRIEPWETYSRAIQVLRKSGIERPASTDRDFEEQIWALVQLNLQPLAGALEEEGRNGRSAATQAVVRGHLLFGSEQWEEARQAFERAASLGSSSVSHVLAHAYTLLHLDRLEAAENLLRGGIRDLVDEEGRLHHELVRVLTKQTRYDEAIDVLREATTRGLTDRDRLICDNLLRPLTTCQEYRHILEILGGGDSLASPK